jgi:hypothetical protein
MRRRFSGKGCEPRERYAGEFPLAVPVEGQRTGALVFVSVSADQASQLLLKSSSGPQVLTDADVLLCGHVGALELRELGYTGPLTRRPRLAHVHDQTLPVAADAPPPTESKHR